MAQNLLIIPVLTAIGCCLWMRRQSWRVRWDRALTLSILLQGIGFALCIPANSRYLGRWMFTLMGVAHLRDYVGHLCFLSAAGAMIYVAASRLLPDENLERFMRRIEIPAATAALAMLGCMIFSPALRHPTDSPDFFQAHRDGWLVAYWLIYLGTCAYLLRYLVNLLFLLRQDDRNLVTASLYIAACRIGFIALILAVINVVSSRSQIHAVWILVPLCLASGLSVAAGAWSWWQRNRQLAESGAWRLT